MSQGPYILAHDLGTTGNKATLFDAAGAVVASTVEPYDTAYPRPNWAEQDPAEWQRAVFKSTRDLLAQAQVAPGNPLTSLEGSIAAISFSGHMQGAVFVDRAGTPLRPTIIWADQRATAQADRIRQLCGEDTVYRITGHRVSAAYTAAKVLWVKEHQPETYRQTYKVLQTKDYAAFLLTGVFATDYSDASGTQVFDLERRRWSDDLLQTLGIRSSLLPDVHPSTTVIGTVTLEAAAATGLVAGTPVIIGGGDGACATVGAGSVREGDAYNYLGSSAWIALTTRDPIFDSRRRTFTFAHLDPELYFPIGTMQTACGAQDWLARILNDDKLHDAAAQASPGSGNLLFLPYLMGERSPHWNPHARAAFVGLAMPHGKAELSRAVLEGVAFNLRVILDALRGQGVKIESMRLIGGGARSPTWRQILADVYNLPISRLGLDVEATALGAAVAGGIGVGIFSNFDVVRDMVPALQAEQPDPVRSAHYEALYELFEQTYGALEPVYERLAALAE